MSAPSFEVRALDPHRRRDREQFIALPFELARHHAAWHPGLRRISRALLDPHRNPFWRRTSAELFVVRRNGKVVAQAGVVAPGAIPQRSDAATLILPDFADDGAAVTALFDTIAERARAMGAAELVGPMNPDLHHDVGVQISGFGRRNAVFMGYQPAYYSRRLEEAGFEPLLDFDAWELRADSPEDPSLARLVARVERGGGIRIRCAEPSRFDEELVRFHHLYCASFTDHWGFTPPDWAEFRHLAGDLRHILRRGMALIAERDDAPVGFVLSVPDIFSVLPRQRSGRITPLLLARACWRWRRLDAARVMIAGVLPAHRRLGVHLPLLHRLRHHLVELGYRRAEISWVMAGNRPLQRVLPLLGARPIKRYRIYARRLAS